MSTDRRHFLGTALMTVAASSFRLTDLAKTPVIPGSTGDGNMTVPSSRSSFDSLKQIDAGLLNVGYAETGPANGPPVILLHGWPYDIHASSMSLRFSPPEATA